MRISRDPVDPGIDAWLAIEDVGARVYLDGQELTEWITADEERNLVIVLRRYGGERILIGQVRIEIIGGVTE